MREPKRAFEYHASLFFTSPITLWVWNLISLPNVKRGWSDLDHWWSWAGYVVTCAQTHSLQKMKHSRPQHRTKAQFQAQFHPIESPNPASTILHHGRIPGRAHLDFPAIQTPASYKLFHSPKSLDRLLLTVWVPDRWISMVLYVIASNTSQNIFGQALEHSWKANNSLEE